MMCKVNWCGGKRIEIEIEIEVVNMPMPCTSCALMMEDIYVEPSIR
jgi:hypothetical protein